MSDQPHNPESNNGRGSYPGAPRWVKVFGLIMMVVVLLLVIGMLQGGGRHGPGRHIRGGDTAGGHRSPSNVGHEVQRP